MRNDRKISEKESDEFLRQSSIWENDQYVFQIEKRKSEFRAVMFSKEERGLKFVEAAFYKDFYKLVKLIEKIKLLPTKKQLVLRRNDDTSRSDLGKR